VIADRVSRSEHPMQNRPVARRLFADDEKGCAHCQLIEQIEQARRYVRIGSVVKSQENARTAGQLSHPLKHGESPNALKPLT
jgi:hypothetical protein